MANTNNVAHDIIVAWNGVYEGDTKNALIYMDDCVGRFLEFYGKLKETIDAVQRLHDRLPLCEGKVTLHRELCNVNIPLMELKWKADEYRQLRDEMRAAARLVLSMGRGSNALDNAATATFGKITKDADKPVRVIIDALERLSAMVVVR